MLLNSSGVYGCVLVVAVVVPDEWAVNCRTGEP